MHYCVCTCPLLAGLTIPTCFYYRMCYAHHWLAHSLPHALPVYIIFMHVIAGQFDLHHALLQHALVCTMSAHAQHWPAWLLPHAFSVYVHTHRWLAWPWPHASPVLLPHALLYMYIPIADHCLVPFLYVLVHAIACWFDCCHRLLLYVHMHSHRYPLPHASPVYMLVRASAGWLWCSHSTL